MISSATFASAMDLKTALDITLHTNPEIAESAANRRAIDFEYEQAKRLSLPTIIIEGRAGPEWVDSRTTRLLGNDEDVLWGRQASVTMQQNLYDFGRNESERDRQASRVDSAAHRVWERSELVSLDVVQAYLDVMRLRNVENLADENVAEHQTQVNKIAQGRSGGVEFSGSDAQQADERLSAAKVSRNETEEAQKIAQSNFVRLVGRDIGVPSIDAALRQRIRASMPGSLSEALRQARTSNPTLHIARGDLATARAEYRKAKADNKPSLSLEVAGRAGEDIGGFRDTTNDVRAQLVFRHEFRGGIKSSAVQEHINWVDEKRQRLLRLERSVDNLVREAWATKEAVAMRRQELQRQVDQGALVKDSYNRELPSKRRTLLDVLDAQSSLFQAKTSLTTAEHAELFAQFRLLASTGRLLEVMELSPRREANANVRQIEGTVDNPEADAEPRRYPKHYEKSMGSGTTWSPSIASVKKLDSENLANLDIKPVTKQWASKPGDAPKPARKEVMTVAAPKAPKAPTVAETVVAKAAPQPVVEPVAKVAAAVAPEIVVKEEPVVAEIKDVVVAETPATSAPAPRVYGEYTPAKTYVVTEAAPVIAEPAPSSPVVEPVTEEASVVIAPAPAPKTEPAPVIEKETINVRQEPIMGKIGPVQQEAVLSGVTEASTSVEYASSEANAEDSFPVGVPIKTVSKAEFAKIKTRENAKIYWQMGAVLHDNVLYLME